MKKDLLPLLPLLANVFFHTSVHAQTTKDGTRLAWDQRIAVTQGTITVDKKEHPAHTITVFEADAGTAIDLWRKELTPVSAAITNKPLRATGVRLPQLSEEPLIVLADGTTEKKAGVARLSLAFLVNDSTPLEADAEKYMHDLAVRLNKAVVQGQIDRYQKDLDKTGDKLASSAKDKAKAESNVAKASRDLEKLKSKRGKIQADNAKIHGNITGLEKKFALTNDPKDLQRLTKARSSLAKNEGSLAKLMQQEAKVQGNLNKHQSTLEKHSSKAGDHQESKEDLQRIISELKRKQDHIR